MEMPSGILFNANVISCCIQQTNRTSFGHSLLEKLRKYKCVVIIIISVTHEVTQNNKVNSILIAYSTFTIISHMQ